MQKYTLLHQRVASLIKDIEIIVPHGASDKVLCLAHDAGYVEAVVTGSLDARHQRKIGFPWSPEMVERSRRSVGATIAAMYAAFDKGVGLNLAGGTHHAFAGSGHGFCVFNDVAVSIRHCQQQGLMRYPLVIDLDVHQGDGTADIFSTDQSVFTFSMHGEKNFPLRKKQSSLDISLDNETTDKEYLDKLDKALTDIPQQFEPDCVYYLAGADPYAGDRLGKLALSKQGLASRDQKVFEFCRQRHLPVTVTMAGGYANNIDDIVDIHFKTISTAIDCFSPHM